jgi:hypothetical protein
VGGHRRLGRRRLQPPPLRAVAAPLPGRCHHLGATSPLSRHPKRSEGSLYSCPRPNIRPTRKPHAASGPSKIKFEKLSLFSTSDLVRFKLHIHHTSHHNFTTKTPPKTHLFFQNPLEKHSKNIKKSPSSLQIFSCTFLVFRTSPTDPTSCLLFLPKSKIKSHESLFCCWKRDN